MHDTYLSLFSTYEAAIVEGLHSCSTTPGPARVQGIGTQYSKTFVLVVGASLSCNPNPYPHLVKVRLTSPFPSTKFGLFDKENIVNQDSFNGFSSESTELATYLLELSLLSDGTTSIDEKKHCKSQK